MRTMPHFRHPLQKQTGISLVITLLMLLALTLLGIAALNNNNLQARMTNNAAESNFSFQNSDNAILIGEKWIEAQVKRPVTCTGSCSSSSAVWLPSALGNIASFDWSKARLYGSDYSDDGTATAIASRKISDKDATAQVSQEPKYVIEELGQDQGYGLGTGIGVSAAPIYYRITGLGAGGLSTSKTLTQSIYLKNY